MALNTSMEGLSWMQFRPFAETLLGEASEKREENLSWASLGERRRQFDTVRQDEMRKEIIRANKIKSVMDRLGQEKDYPGMLAAVADLMPNLDSDTSPMVSGMLSLKKNQEMLRREALEEKERQESQSIMGQGRRAWLARVRTMAEIDDNVIPQLNSLPAGENGLPSKEQSEFMASMENMHENRLLGRQAASPEDLRLRELEKAESDLDVAQAQYVFDNDDAKLAGALARVNRIREQLGMPMRRRGDSGNQAPAASPGGQTTDPATAPVMKFTGSGWVRP